MIDIYTVKGSRFSIYIYPSGCSVVRWLSTDARRWHMAANDQNLTLAAAKRRVNQMIVATHDAATRIETH